VIKLNRGGSDRAGVEGRRRGMAEELTTLWGRLSLTEKERLEIEIQDNAVEDMEKRGKRCLMGKVTAERKVSKEVLRSTFLKVWRPNGLVFFIEFSENMFLVEFSNEGDKNKIREGPGDHGYLIRISSL
jgi:hypothetical protein